MKSVSDKDMKQEQLNATVYREKPANQRWDDNTQMSGVLFHHLTSVTEHHMALHIIN